MSTPSLLAIGLGNPGAEYEDTRHNVGHQVIDGLSGRLDISLQHQSDALVGWGRYVDQKIGLAVPLTYMNRSGDAVAGLRAHYDLPIDRLLVIVDDLHLPVGTIRLRPTGSSGGHNGLAHVAQRLGTTEFSRLRVGIGNDFPEGRQSDYVLSPFTDEQRPAARSAREDAEDAVLTMARDDIDAAMNRFN
ncbi:aminoacyl-tRNA hydrolase [Salinibacter ruber]|jgi:PTH1 family peptidyl-tRNA hydrolase|uniref:Peptidyl-tRNA hydrolase n=2 Tax=Salinibacter ruber TaxID=146919 RepID=PTH_SALRD|nr:aminoacyl-tRNA hydrolase [Salinibacter ruber]Q2S4D2.1 RecName: Full=Peptidyl-tRNA hydrolase; Short=PTH [Salinibacter ruber DSM 13855]ABC45122.1 peptidyl-tRNA hydrolase [Salinibacter ruber DSM 13855]MBB4091204.1 PTH1 family peptidyl-tRNA hydrolase [Salinibacter ruber]MCS3611462.1 PTH1 family peptidyl-tRNA hydrolase [Salinibacter ruber]MCS3615480.1 PTH1 family peptidyl-tRNA hydrolase [Salinibacter ruber]MCS3629225.1 PTH1 family peptidyl-tRNA hydrolase [Salinibacter ruber]